MSDGYLVDLIPDDLALARSGVLQSLSDLRRALVLGAGAAGRLVLGLAGLALDAVGGRARAPLSDCAFSAQSRACRAHGAMS